MYVSSYLGMVVSMLDIVLSRNNFASDQELDTVWCHKHHSVQSNFNAGIDPFSLSSVIMTCND